MIKSNIKKPDPETTSNPKNLPRVKHGVLKISNGLLLMIGEYLSIGEPYHFLLTFRWLPPLFMPRLHQLCLEDIGGLTALQWASERSHASLAKWQYWEVRNRQAAGAAGSRVHQTPLHLAASKNDCDFIRILLKHGARIAAHDDNKLTPLHLAMVPE